MSFPHILFDLDGTLTDPFEGITGSVQHALKRAGLPVPPKEELRHFIGPPLGASFMQHCGLNETEGGQMVEYYREYFADKGLYENQLFDGVPKMLQTLQDTGRKLYIATSKPEFFAVKVLQHFNILQYFTLVVGSPMDNHGTQKPEIVQQVLKKGGIPATSAVMVGDRRYDVEGAKANGLPCVGVLFGYGGEEELREAGADWLVPDIPALQALLLG